MSPKQPIRKPGDRIPYIDTRQPARNMSTTAEEIAKHLDEKRKAVLERSRLVDIERHTAEDEMAIAQLRDRTIEIERRSGGKDGVGGDPDGQKRDGPDAKGDQSRIWQVDEEKLRLRPARSGEPALTFAEANEVLREMKQGEDVPIIIFNAETGQHIPNPQSDFAKKNPTIAWATAKEYDKQLTAGNEPDAVEILLDQKKKWANLMEAVGIKESGSSELAILDRLEKLGLIVKPQDAGGPVLALLTEISQKLDKGDKGDPKVEALEKQLQALNEQLAKDREDRLREQITALQGQNRSLSERIEQVAKERTADTEIGLMGKGLDKIDSGATGVRDLLIEVFKPRAPAVPTDRAGQRALVTGNMADEALLLQERSRLFDKIFFKRPAG